MSDHNNIYNIMGKLSALTPVEQTKQETKPVYESVEAKGSVLEGVKKVQAALESKLASFKEERETLKTKKGTIYKGGTYGTDFDAGDEDGEKKKKPKAKDGEKKGRGRPKKEKPAEYSGPKGDIFGRTTGTAPKGKKGTVVKGKANQDTVDESAPKGWEGTVKAMKKHKEIDNPYALTNYMKKKGYKSHVKEGKLNISKALMESVNFRKMMDEANMTVDEMLEGLNSDIQAYKATGDMSNRLRDFMHLHSHMKKMEEGSMDPQMPSGQDILPKQSTLGKIGSKVMGALTGPSDDELLAQLQQDTQPQRTGVEEELDELAKLAGISEATCNECGMYESKCACDHDHDMEEGNEFSGELAQARAAHKDSFEVDGKTYPVKESTSLKDIAKLSGIFQEGRDYGDTSYNEPPTYDNSPDECVQGEEVLLKGGDGEVAGKEKAMHNDKPTFKNADNPLSEDKALLKPAAEFNFVKEMGRDLMKAYQGIKTK